jgi:hypothetical protein
MIGYIERKLASGLPPAEVEGLKKIINELKDEALKKKFMEELGKNNTQAIPIIVDSKKSKKFCYWSVANNEHAKMAATLVKSARNSGVREDFHVWSDITIDGAINHPCGSFSIKGCWFKLDFLLNEVAKLDYEYFVWLDADHYFVRNPRNIMEHVDNGLVMIPMENEITSVENKRGDWWSVPTQKTIDIFREFGCKNRKIYNTNGGLFVVKKEFIKTFYHMCYEFHDIIKTKGWDVPEEYCLAIMGNLLNKDINLAIMSEIDDIWACDWTNAFTDNVPEGKPWIMENYLTGKKETVNPAIVHCMRGKKGLISRSGL